MNRLLRSLLDRLWPSQCVLCESHAEGSVALCGPCYIDLPWIDCHCAICSIPMARGQHPVCGKCLHQQPAYSQCIAAFEYRYPIDKMIINFKSNGHLITGNVLANLLADIIAIQLDCDARPDLIIPIPLHRTQFRQRGFNQSMEIAAVISGRLGIPLDHQICLRIKKTSPQKHLSAKERRKNLVHAFSITGTVKGRRIAIVDDVMTTGSTVESLARQLYESGAADVQVWVLARTPQPPG